MWTRSSLQKADLSVTETDFYLQCLRTWSGCAHGPCFPGFSSGACQQCPRAGKTWLAGSQGGDGADGKGKHDWHLFRPQHLVTRPGKHNEEQTRTGEATRRACVLFRAFLPLPSHADEQSHLGSIHIWGSISAQLVTKTHNLVCAPVQLYVMIIFMSQKDG